MKNPLRNRSLVSILDLSKEDILLILKKAEEMKKKTPQQLLKGKILASCFFEPSTRTRLCFEAAMLRLGGNVIGFSDAASTSAKKGETLHDTMKVVGEYADIVVVRHPDQGSAQIASAATDTPVINAGDGANQHPTQALLDLFTMKECFGKFKGLNIAFVGDLKHSRTVHSLSLACAHFNMNLLFVSPEHLSLPEEVTRALKKRRVIFSAYRTIGEAIAKADVLYMTRLQKERFEVATGGKWEDDYILREKMLKKAKRTLKIFHPLPRVNEIETAVDKSPHAWYFQQAKNGLYVRMALLALILKDSRS